MEIRFLKKTAYKPGPNETQVYEAGMTTKLPKEKAERLIASGHAEALADESRSKRSSSK